MIKTIAFDLWGCLLKENDIKMTPQEEILERNFWNLNFDEKYFSWATKTLSLSEEEIKKILSPLRPKLYSLREEWIFEKIHEKYPYITFAIASNHISQVKESLKFLKILEKCKVVLISWDSGYEKPFKGFYELLVDMIWLPANETLFIDDIKENIQGAENVWLNTLHCYRWMNLTESILNYLAM